MSRKPSLRAFVASTLAVLLLLAVCAPQARADRYNRSSDGHPLRLVAYALHPIGIGLEYGIMRPIHWIVSRPGLDIVFGHQSSVMEDPYYFEWVHGDYLPSIAEKSEAMSDSDASMPTVSRY